MVQHINSTQEFQSDHPMPLPGLHMGSRNMFSFGGDSDNKDEEGVAFADRTFTEVDPGGGLQRNTSWSRRFDTQNARYPGGPPRGGRPKN
jgi:hypothetical protein